MSDHRVARPSAALVGECGLSPSAGTGAAGSSQAGRRLHTGWRGFGSALPRLAAAAVLAAAIWLPGAPGNAGEYRLERLVEGSAFHGIHGLAFDAAGRLFAGSVVGQSIYEVDPQSGAVAVKVGPPEGLADDIAFAPDGTMVWTGFLNGSVFAMGADGVTRKLAEGLPGINSLAFSPSGRLFATQVFLGDALYEIDPAGLAPPRKIAEGLGGLNGFDFGPDGLLYGPLWFKGAIAKVDIDTGEVTEVAAGFSVPAAANFGPDGALYVLDTMAGEIVRVDVSSGAKTVVAKTKASLDNLDFDPTGRLYVSNMADNGIYEVDLASGALRTVVEGKLATSGDLALSPDGRTLYVADDFAFRSVDVGSGAVTDHGRVFESPEAVEYPLHVSWAGDRVLVSGWFTGTVQIFDPAAGKLVSTWRNFVTPTDTVALPDGSLLVAEVAKGELTRVAGENGDERTAVVTGLAGPVGLAAAADGTVFLSEIGGRVSRIDPTTWELTVLAEGLASPQGMDVAADGRLLVAEKGAQRIVAIDLNTKAVTTLAEGLPIGGLMPIPGLPPIGIFVGLAAAENGTIYIASDGESAIYRLVPQ